MKSINLKSVIRKKRKRYVKSIPQVIAENMLNKNFNTAKPNKKWLTDVTKFKLYYLRKFHNFEELKLAIDNYIEFYNNIRLQKKQLRTKSN